MILNESDCNRHRKGPGGDHRRSVLLAQHSINILDISQTILQEYFTMVMLVDTAACDKSIVEISQLLEQAGQERGLSIRIQREDIFNAMHRI